MYMFIQVHTCFNLYRHVHMMYKHVHTCLLPISCLHTCMSKYVQLMFRVQMATYSLSNVQTLLNCVRTLTSAKWGVHIYAKYAEYTPVSILHIENGFAYFLTYFLHILHIILHIFCHILHIDYIYLVIFCILFCIFIVLFYILHIILHIYLHILHIYVEYAEYRPVSILHIILHILLHILHIILHILLHILHISIHILHI